MKIKLKELKNRYYHIDVCDNNYGNSLNEIPLQDEIYDLGELVCHYDILNKKVELPAEIDYSGKYMGGIIHGTIHTSKIIQETKSYPEENKKQIVYHYLINDEDIIDINDIDGEQFEDWMLD